MQNITIRNTEHGTEVEIDGIKIDLLTSFRLEKRPDSPMEIELSGVIFSEARVET